MKHRPSSEEQASRRRRPSDPPLDASRRSRTHRSGEKRKIATSVEVIAASFIARHAKPRLRSWREYDHMLRDYVLPEWGSRPITEIKRSDVTALLDVIEEKRSAALADHVLAVIRKLFNWHAARDEQFLSPLVIGMARTSITARARDRVLTDDEVRALWQTLQHIPYPFGSFVQLLLLTAQHRPKGAPTSSVARCSAQIHSRAPLAFRSTFSKKPARALSPRCRQQALAADTSPTG